MTAYFSALCRLCLLTLVVFACLNLTQAQTSPQPQTPSDDPIIHFARADSNEKATLLSAWPYSDAEKQKLLDLMRTDALYTDSDGNIYLIKDDTDLVTYPDETVVEDWPDSLEGISLNNRLRAALAAGEATAGLQSDDPAIRLKAVKTLSRNPDSLDIEQIHALLKASHNDDVIAALNTLLAQKQLGSADSDVQIQAAQALKSSNDPKIASLLTRALQRDDLSENARAVIADAQKKVDGRISRDRWYGHIFSGLSVASILLLAALGLAITYGLLGVINMAHGEMIMIGAYATWLTQNAFARWLPDWFGWYLPVSVITAFLTSAAVGILIERTVIRPLYGRQLETLLATFGVSLVLIQVVRLIFGPQNVPITTPDWLSGSVTVSPALLLPYNRIAIIVLTLAVLFAVKLLISRSRFGLFVRAVTQNRQMARCVGVRSARIDMLAFGLGSGLAGIAGCALTQIGNVGPEMGQSLIVDTFLVVVVGGVGQLAGAALAALGLGLGGTLLEVSMGAVLAKILLLLAVIVFIQKRPQGLFAVKGRFVD